MPQFAAGVVKFQTDVYPNKKDLFEELSKGQSPEALFITCSDSRIETAMITQTEPGELFICRNAGNIVPPHTNSTGGMTASIEFATAVLRVPHIVVCGHTECGAMKGAMNPDSVESLPHVKEWLGYSKAAVDIVKEIAGDASPEEQMRLLLERNVVLQLQHLKTHPTVAARLAKGDLQLHGWLYDIKSGGVTAYDESKDAFLNVTERYASEMAALATADKNCAA
ncbi:carbonic anhydrase [Hyphococcus sp. DH-69]|uniref:carbonic anhydrase n=1 Tax=Hyphococcus formosus TaxID=3143534 RepID=UPI00398A697F